MQGSQPNPSTYPVYTVALLIFAVGLLLKVVAATSLTFFGCAQFRTFWADSFALPTFAIVAALLVTYSLSPLIQTAFGGPVTRAEFWWSLVAFGFALYVSAMLVVLYAFVHPDGWLGRLFGFGAGEVACI